MKQGHRPEGFYFILFGTGKYFYMLLLTLSVLFFCQGILFQFISVFKVSKGAKIRNRYNQVPYMTQDTNEKVTNLQQAITNESQQDIPSQAGDHKAHINRRLQRHSKHKTEKTQKINKISTALERSVKYFTGGLKPF